MMDTVDLRLWGGWHVTLFHPWALFATGLAILSLCALLAKRLLLH
jgi:hypothetical protein